MLKFEKDEYGVTNVRRIYETPGATDKPEVWTLGWFDDGSFISHDRVAFNPDELIEISQDLRGKITPELGSFDDREYPTWKFAEYYNVNEEEAASMRDHLERIRKERGTR